MSLVPGVLAAALGVVIATAAAQPNTPDRGEGIMSARCTTCHDLRPIETQALDEAGWSKEIQSMIDRGAEVSKEEIPVLTDYLVRMHGPLPDGPGKELLLDVCTRCHDLQRIRRQKRTAEAWLEILETMLNEGAPLSEEDLPVVLRYLARNFRPDR